MLLWLKKHDFLSTYKLLRDETRLPSLEDVAYKLCAPFVFPNIARLWLNRKGYFDESLKKAYYGMFDPSNALYASSRPLRLQFYADNVGLFFGVMPQINEYIATYKRLRSFVQVSVHVH